jgi:hypothetical protein
LEGIGAGIGGGSEDAAPSTGLRTIGASLWLGRRWGFAVADVRALGVELRDEFHDSLDRVFLGEGGLRYFRTTVRHRGELNASTLLLLGVGLAHGGRSASIQLLKRPEGLRRIESETRWGGFAGELFVDSRLSRHFGLRAGATLDWNGETSIIQPVMLALVRY